MKLFSGIILVLLVINSLAFPIIKNADSPLVFDEVSKLKGNNLKNVTERFQKELIKEQKLQGYIINFGTTKEIAKREKIIKNTIAVNKFDSSRITIVNGGNHQTKSVFYFVPFAVERPNP